MEKMKKKEKKEKKCEKMKKMWKKSQLGCLNMDAKKSRAKNYFVTCVAQHDEIFFCLYFETMQPISK